MVQVLDVEANGSSGGPCTAGGLGQGYLSQVLSTRFTIPILHIYIFTSVRIKQ